MKLHTPQIFKQLLPVAVFILLLVSACGTTTVSTERSAAPHFKLGAVTVFGKHVDENEVDEFLGLPFAEPPIGSNRWKPAVLLNNFSANNQRYQATNFAPACMQGTHIADWYKGVIESFGGDAGGFPVPQVSEDCLYLNIWRPSHRINTPLPVMVYLHGGSNKGGWAYEPNYIGASLASNGVIVVSVPYRLGVFGFFSHPELSHANFALTDMIAALRWINQNIAAVGGNPNNITLFGESAGASNIAYLMASPVAKGLFQRAIHQSAGWAMYGTQSKNELEHFAVELANTLGAGDKKQIESLRQASAEQLLNTAEEVYVGHFYDVVIDGQTIVKPLSDSFRSGDVPDLDLMIGNNANESRMYLPEAATVDSWLAEQNADEVKAKAVQNYLAASETNDPLEKLDLLATSYNYACPSLALARLNATAGNQTWYYYFTQQREGELGTAMGSYHGAELPYVFDTHDDWLPTSSADRKLTKAVMEYWVSFATSGSPNRPQTNLPFWQSYQNPSHKVQFLGQETVSELHPSHQLCALLENQ